MSASALDGVKVVELGEMIAAPYCGKLLGDLGADVIKVEPPSGDEARRTGPFPNPKRDPEHSALFLYTNTSKRGVTLNIATEQGIESLRRLIAWADVFIDGTAPGTLAEQGLDTEAVRNLNPGLVYTSVTPYGRSGARANDPGDELTLVHAAGLGNLLPTRSTDANRAPVKPGGNPVGFHGGLAAAVATLAALLAREKSRMGTHVDVSLQEVIVAMLAPQIGGARYHGSTYSRVPDRPPAMGRMQTADGYVILNALDDHHFASLRELMGNPEWCASDEWNSLWYRANNLMEIAPLIDEWMLKQNKDDIHHKAAAKRIPIGPMYTAEEVMNYQQYDAREYFVEVEHPDAGTQRYAGWPYKMPKSPPRVHRPAPRLGEHNDEVLQNVSMEPSGAAKKQGGGALPLEGVRVLEFAWVWAGPYCGQLLAQLGAEVVKVESHNRMDLMRRAVVWPLSDPMPAVVPPSEGIAFNSVNMNKKSVAIDMSKPEGVAIAQRLAATSHVVFDNMRPGALAKLGLGYDALVKLREDIIVASSSGRGTTGPEREYLGYAMIHHALGGNAYITGYPDDHPCHTTGDVDIMNATTLAFAILAAIHHHQRSGEGQFIDFSQTEAVSSLIGDVLLGYELTKEVPERTGNAHATFAPHNVYRAWGVDRWLAIEVHNDAEFKALCDVMGQPELTSDPKFATPEARKQNETELDALIEAWTRARDRDRTVGRLLEAGVAAAPSRDARDVYADPHLKERGAFVTVHHETLGELELINTPWRMPELQAEPQRAPFLGEHTNEVLNESLKLKKNELDDLRSNGIIQ